mgnify:CR=1 FL=1
MRVEIDYGWLRNKRGLLIPTGLFSEDAEKQGAPLFWK